MKVVIGAALPLALVVLYFYAKGALGDLWSYAIVYNYSVFGPEARQPLADAGSHLWIIIRRVFEKKTVLLILALGGLVIYIAERLYVKFKQGWPVELFRDAIIWPDGTRSSLTPHPSVIVGNKSSVIVGPGVFVGKGNGVVPMDNPSSPNKARCAVLDGVSYCY